MEITEEQFRTVLKTVDELTAKLIHTQILLKATQGAFLSYVKNRHPEILEFVKKDIENCFKAVSKDTISRYKSLSDDAKVHLQIAVQSYNFDEDLN